MKVFIFQEFPTCALDESINFFFEEENNEMRQLIETSLKHGKTVILYNNMVESENDEQ